MGLEAGIRAWAPLWGTTQSRLVLSAHRIHAVGVDAVGERLNLESVRKRTTYLEALHVLSERLVGQLDGHHYVRAARPTVPHAAQLDPRLSLGFPYDITGIKSRRCSRDIPLRVGARPKLGRTPWA